MHIHANEVDKPCPIQCIESTVHVFMAQIDLENVHSMSVIYKRTEKNNSSNLIAPGSFENHRISDLAIMARS